MDALNSSTRASMVDGVHGPGNVGYGDQTVPTFDAATATDYRKVERPSTQCEDSDSQRIVMRNVDSKTQQVNKAAQRFWADAR